MVQLNLQDLLQRIVGQGIGSPCDYLLAVVDRVSGLLGDKESVYVDFKVGLNFEDASCLPELARDVLAFSNTYGGILIFGVTADHRVVGNPEVDSHLLREKLGPFIGTMVSYETGLCKVHVSGREKTLPYILVPRCTRAYPNLLRKDIPTRSGFGRKIKYMRGSLFYRDGDQTLVEPTGGDIDARAAELKFTGASPRTRSSFLVEEDRPGVRLYAHINDRFVGRREDVGEILSKFDDIRGRGVSIAGLGGMGKTELAIEVAAQSYKSGRFKCIYSGSAKRLLLGMFGPQVSDPWFSDFPGFLRDLGAWLGLDFQSTTTIEEMKAKCLGDLKSRNKVLLFVDNLETIEDGRLFQFLDHEIPDNVWLLTTSRVHKVKNYVYQKSLEAMNPGDASHLLRHELKRQGLLEYASMPIATLEQRAIQLQRHPLLIRWYAWSCSREKDNWSKTPKVVPRAEVESFCIGHTLQSLSFSAQKVLAGIADTQDQIDVTPECLERVSRVVNTELEVALDDLESAGLISVALDDRTGLITYTTLPLANEPARELARKNDWERGFSRGFKEYIEAKEETPTADPLVRYLVQFDPGSVRNLTPDEILELKKRIDRALERPHAFRIPLLALAAECERHSDHIITADDYYKEAAELILAGRKPIDQKSSKVLLEAATVAKFRSSTEPQLRRAISYLASITDIEFAPLRILGMMVEFSARIGDEVAYKEYLDRLAKFRQNEGVGRFSPSQIAALDEALARAANAINDRRAGRH